MINKGQFILQFSFGRLKQLKLFQNFIKQFSIKRMKSKFFRKFNTNNPLQALSNARSAFRTEMQVKKIEQSLEYLNKSFNYNIQMQETFIDISKGKKKNINSKQIKKLYQIFSENKANQCIFLKTYNMETQVHRDRSIIDDDFINRNSSSSQLMKVIEEQDENAESDKNINKNFSSKISKKGSIQSKLIQPFQIDDKQKTNNFKQIQNQRQKVSNNQELSFLLKRIYCRLIQKMLVKIAFYNMNSKHLQCISQNVNLLTRSLQTAIRKLKYLKDTRFLHQTILKIYRQNFIIQAEIYKSLVNGGFIMSIDQFYRVNGLDADSKEVYQRNSELLQVLQRQEDLKKQEQHRKNMRQLYLKQQKEKSKKIKEKHLQKINNQIQERYKQCLYEMKKLLNQEGNPDIQQQLKQGQHESIEGQNDKGSSIDSSADRPNFKKTLAINRGSHEKIKPFRKSRFSQIKQNWQQDQTNIAIQKGQNKIFYQTVSTPRAYAEVFERNRKQGKIKSMLPLSKRLSAFTPEFSKILKSVPNSKLQVSTKYLSQKFLQFDQSLNSKNGQKSISKNYSLRKTSKTSKNSRIKKDSSSFESVGINKILKLYEKKNSQNQKFFQQVEKQVITQIKNEISSPTLPKDFTSFDCEQLYTNMRKPKSSFYKKTKYSSFYQSKKAADMQLKNQTIQGTQKTSENIIESQNKITKDFQREYRYSLANKSQMDYYHKKRFNLSKNSPRSSSNIIKFKNFRNLSLQKIIQHDNNCQKKKIESISIYGQVEKENSVNHHRNSNSAQNANVFQNLNRILKSIGSQANTCNFKQTISLDSQKPLLKERNSGPDEPWMGKKGEKFTKYHQKIQKRQLPSLTAWRKQNILQQTKFSIFARKYDGKGIQLNHNLINLGIKEPEQSKVVNKIMKKAYRSANFSPKKQQKIILNMIKQDQVQENSHKIYQLYDVRRRLFIQ